MKVFIVYAHPEPKSFNGAMFSLAQEVLRDSGQEVMTSDLYGMGFDPLSRRRNFTTVRDADFLRLQLEELHASEHEGFAPEIEQEIEKIEWCDLMIWQFPLWWFGLPGILKGWVDRVFAMGRVYGGGHLYATGTFSGKRALLSLTTGAPPDAYERGGFNGDINAILRPIQRGMLQFVGFEVLAPQIVYSLVRLSDQQRQDILRDYARRLRTIDQEQPIDVGEY